MVIYNGGSENPLYNSYKDVYVMNGAQDGGMVTGGNVLR